MIKSSILLTRKPGMSVEDFQRYWRDEHAPIAAQVPGISRYIQCHTLPEEYEGESPPDYDGIAEIWWDDEAAFEQAQRTPEWAAMKEDEQNFIGDSMLLLVDEVPLVDAYASPRERAGMAKYIAMLFLKEGVPVTELHEHWKHPHGTINVENLKGMRRYVQSRVLPRMFESPNPPPYGGLPEAWFDSVSAMRDAPRDPNARRDTEWPNYCSGQKSIFAKEVVIID